MLSGIDNTNLYTNDRYHPDKNASNPEASELFKEVAYSYSILSDPEKRRQYDSAGFEVRFSPSHVNSKLFFIFFLSV
jgi:DnaJ-class molecular chaperone